MLDGILDDILGDSPKRGEFRPNSPRIRPAESLDIPELSPNSPDLLGEDRHYCRECLNLNSGRYCIQQRFRPVDSIPRHCKDFNGYPDRISQTASGTAAPAPTSGLARRELAANDASDTTEPAPAHNPLLVEVWTPSGTRLMVKADSPEHAANLKRWNPAPVNIVNVP